MSALCFAQSGTVVKLYPTKPKPLKITAHLGSKEERAGNWVYQVFYFRDAPQREAFRVEIGSYEKGQLVKDWLYGIVVEKDMTNDGMPDYVWYGGDDTGQRLLWFLSKEKSYNCMDVFKTAETAWKKRFGRAAPDLGEVGGEAQVSLVTWNESAQILNIAVESSRQAKATTLNFRISPRDFEKCRQQDIGTEQ